MHVGCSANLTRFPGLLCFFRFSSTNERLYRAAAVLAMTGLMTAVAPAALPAVARAEAALTVSINGPSYTIGDHPVDVYITFSKSVSGFEEGDVTVGNASVTDFSGSGASYTVTVLPAASGPVTVDVAANVATDAAGNGNTAASRYTGNADLDPPSVTISGPSAVQTGAFGVTVEFSEPVGVYGHPFEQGDVSVGNGSVTGFSGSGAGYSITITPSASGTVTVDVAASVARDAGGNANTAASQYSVQVTLNSAPEITAPGNKTFRQGQTITTISIPVSDPDGDSFGMTIVGLPSGLSWSWDETSKSLEVTGTVASTATAKDYTVTIEANEVNDGLKATATFTITVTTPPSTPPANRLPVITAPGNKTFRQGQTITTISIPVSDPDGDSFGMTIVGLPSGLSWSWDETSKSLEVTGAVASTAAAKDYTVTIEANEVNDGLKATATFTITVTTPPSTPPANRPPVITAPGNKTFRQGQTITTISIPVSDPDGDSFGMTIVGLPSGLSWSWDETSKSLEVTGTVASTATAKDYTVTIEANEVNDGLKATATFTITVTTPPSTPPANRPPVIREPLVVYGIQYQEIWPFDITVTDPDGDDVTVVVTGLPAGLSYSDGKVQGTPLADSSRIPALTDRTYQYTVEADDGVNPAVTRTFRYHVVYAPPRITVPGDKTVEQGETIAAFDITVDADPKYKTVAVTGLPPGLSYSNGQVQGTVSVDAELMDYTVTITADGDGEGGTVDYPPKTATFTITVTEPVAAPTVAISGPPDPQNGAFDVTITFSEDVAEFEQGDVTVGNGSVTAFSGSGSSYTATITPAASGTVTVDVPAHVATGAADNGNEAASQFSVDVFLPRWIRFEGPTAVRTSDDPFEVRAIFSEAPAPGSVSVTRWHSELSYTWNDRSVLNVTATPGYTEQRGGTWPYTVKIQVEWRDAREDHPSLVATYQVDVDPDPPLLRKRLGITGPTAPQNGPFDIRLQVSEGNLVGFAAGDITVANGSVTSFEADTDYGRYYTVQITPAASGRVSVSIGAATFKDRAGWDNKASPVYSVLADLDAPTVGISGPTDAQNGAFDATITFSEPVTGFKKGDVSVGNGSVTAFSGSGDRYTATVTPAATGAVTVDVAAIVAVDEAGNGNASASRYSVQADLVAPTVGISGPADAQNGAFDATITFSEPVTGFEKGDVTVGNGTVTAFSGSGDRYTATVTPAATGAVTVDVAARAARDSAGNGNKAATRFSVQADVDRPSVGITGPAATQTGAFDVSIAFSESVSGFEQGDVTVGNGTVTAFSGTGASYAATITPAATGLVTVDVAANVADDAVGNGNSAADRLSITASLDVSNPLLEIIAPADKTYAQGETIASFGIPVISVGVGEPPGGAKRAFGNANPVTVAESDLPAVAVGGLPSGLSYTSRKVQGTVSTDAAAKTYTVAINATNVNGQFDEATFRITVTAATEVTVSDATAVEGEALSFTVRLAGAVPGGLTVTPVFGVGTASADADYTADATPLSFTGAAGEEKAFTVPTIEDEVVEASETFPVGLVVSGTTATVTATDTATGTITDDDADGSVTVTASDASAVEGDALSFTVRLARAVQGGLTVTPVFGDVTATSGADYTVNTAALSFIGTAGEERTFTVPTIEDDVEEKDETFTLSLVVSDAPSGVSAGGATGTIRDDDDDIRNRHESGVPTLTVSDASAVEGNSITFTVTLHKAVSGGLTATPTFADGTAVEGADYTANTASINFTGTVGEERSFTVATTDDMDAEDNETFTVGLTVSNAPPEVTAGNPATGTIQDDDGTVFVSIHDPDSPVAEGSSVELPVTLSSSVGGTVEVPWTTSSSGPASKISVADRQSGHEHEPSSGTVILAAGQTEAIIEIIILDDEEHEDLESFGIDLGEPSVASGASQKVVVDRRSATVTILDNDAPPVFDDGDAAIRTVAENTPPGTAIGTPVSATDAEDDPLSYTLGGTDASAFSLDRATGQLSTKDSLDFEVKSVYDGLTVTVDDGHGHTDVLSLTVNVTDVSPPDAPDAPSVVRSPGDPAGSLDVSWTAPADNGGPIADYDVRYREAGTTAWRDHAFDGTGASTTIAGLKAATTYEVQVLARNAEGDGAWSKSGRGATHDPSTVRKTVTMANAGAAEGGVLTFAVRLNRTVPGGLTVTPVIRGGTATRGRDYTADVAGIRFAGTAGETHTFSVATAQDEVVEHNETVTVGLSISGTSVSGLTTGVATGTITDDDRGTVTTGSGKASEGDALTFHVRLDRAVQGGLTVTPVFRDGTATSETDYSTDAKPVRFTGAAGEKQTFKVATTEDGIVEENETFTVALRVSNAPSGVTAGDPVTGTIIDDDGPNEAPGFDAGLATTRTVAENTPAGGAVGDPVEATDPNGDALSYTLSGSDAFAIDSGTGQIMVSEGTLLDYEAGPLSHTVTVTVDDGREGSDVIDVAIGVTDVAEPPSAPAAPRVTGASLTSVQAVWRVPANTGPAVSDYDVRYRKQGLSAWVSHAFSGTKTVAAIPGLESEATYEVQVRAKNAEGAGAWSPVGSGRTRVNMPPVAVDDAVTVFRGRTTTSLWTGDTRNDARNPYFAPPEDFDIPEPDAGAKIAPLANSAAVSPSDDGSISVLANDVDAEDDRSRLTAILVEAPVHGALTLYEDGTFVYNHDGGRVAEDRFTYRVLDSRGASSDAATVTIAIKGINLGPAVVGTIPDQVLTMGTNGTVDLTGLFADPDGDPLEYEASPDRGIVNVSLVGKAIALTPVAVATTRVTVTARDPYGMSARLSFAVTVETLRTNRARALELSLAAFGRTVLSQAVDAVVGRFEATSRALRATLGGGSLGLGQAFNTLEWVRVAAGLFGIRLDAPVPTPGREATALDGLSGSTPDPTTVRPVLRAPSGRSVLTRSSFQLAMDPSGSADNGWTFWGRGAGSRYSGDPNSDNRMDGSVTAAYVGADYNWNSKLVAGLAASYSNGVQDLDNAGNSIGKWKTRLASLHPYVHWSPIEKLGLWGMLGFGTGDAELYSGYGGPLAGTGSSSAETNISSRSAALGARMALTRLGNVDLALTADAFAVSTGSESVAGLRAATGDARRVRLMLNGSTEWSMTPDTRMDLSLALGARVDGGDTEKGLGTELAGALSLSNRRIGLDLEARSHWLVAHQDRDFREGGLSLALRLDPGADSKGLALSVEPRWGKSTVGGVNRLWDRDRMAAYRNGTDGRERMDWRPNSARAGLDYGLVTRGGRGRLAPFVDLDVAGAGIHRLGGGLRLIAPGASNGSAGILSRNLQLELLGEVRLPGQGLGTDRVGAPVGTPDYRVGFSLSRNF